MNAVLISWDNVSGTSSYKSSTPSKSPLLTRFLASDKSEYITGQVLAVNGGMVI